MSWKRKEALEWTIDQIQNKLAGFYNVIDAVFYLQGKFFVDQLGEMVDVPIFSNEPLTERQKKLFVAELSKHIPSITWEEYKAYSAEKEAEADAIIKKYQEEQAAQKEEKREEDKGVKDMKNVTPKTVLLALGKTVREFQEMAKLTNKQPKRAIEYEAPTKTIMIHGEKIMGVYYHNDDDAEQVKQVLFQLQKHGYVTSRLVEQSTHWGKRYGKIKYNVRAWRLTEKGLSKLKELAKKSTISR